ncbi:pyridoxal-phosphate dependent enzyme, partial [Enterococcus faecium]|uniref:pyridoxal-phosphate dependent enzyme n=1 Tax=Enterococcus faecium TaxID=1352 RepID=UPI0030C8044F
DGNHGRGVAWAANKLGQKSVVLMPKGSTQTRKENIEKEGATDTIEEVNYDECVRMANKRAEETENGVMDQDTVWDGYETIQNRIMQGYGTMALEASQQLRKFGSERPSHVFVQAGVGSLAGAEICYFANAFPENPPIMVVVEAQAADWLYQSAIKNDGEIRFVDGDLQTIMAGLACGEPNRLSFSIIKNHTSFFV